MTMRYYWVPLGIILVGIILTGVSQACNEAICASRVSKCMLLKSCDCDMSNKKNCTCCKDCQMCLAKLYIDCCSCVGMCPKISPEDQTYKTSTVEDLKDPIPELFNVLTEDVDKYHRWSWFKYPVHLDLYLKPNTKGIIHITAHKKKHQDKHDKDKGKEELDFEEPQNCTVAFMSVCMSLHKCKASCISMGSARYRWFHEHGCCQCIGDTCLGYGKNEPVCMNCPEPDDQDREVVLMNEGEINKAGESSQMGGTTHG